MAKALLAERMTGDSKAREVWGSVLDLPAETYAREAAEMFEALGARKRADTLRGRFHLTV
jgi:hypothetical protein